MSKNTFQSIRGMRDLIGADATDFEYLQSVVREQLHCYGYQPFHPPILETTELFSRAVGEGTDVVEKEMYSFEDGKEMLTLRPEGTAGVVRAAIEHGMTFGTHRLWTVGPMFRRERPQADRYRQFFQFSIEAFGMPEPEVDAEQILFCASLWEKLDLTDHVELRINTLATPEVRDKYRYALVEYLVGKQDQLDEDSQRRLTKNPLRILDSKNPDMADLIANAPKLNAYLDNVSVTHFNRVLACLDAANVAYVIDPTLVRGLDYYCHTVYEWVTDKLGAQGTICGGGRYDGLAELLGGKSRSTPAVGFGIGIDRVFSLMQKTGVSPAAERPLAYFVLIGVEAKQKGLMLAQALRIVFEHRVIITHLQNSGIKNQFKKADQSRSEYAIIIGENELTQGEATVKKLTTGVQETIAFDKLTDYISQLR